MDKSTPTHAGLTHGGLSFQTGNRMTNKDRQSQAHHEGMTSWLNIEQTTHLTPTHLTPNTSIQRP